MLTQSEKTPHEQVAMKSKPSLTSCNVKGPSAEPPDRTVYLHFREYRSDVSWPIADYEEKGFFTAAQKDELKSRFDLAPELVSNLSLYVGNTLDIDSVTNLTSVSRNKAVKTAVADLRRAARHARKDPRTRKNLEEVLLECDPMFAETPDDVALLAAAHTLARAPDCTLTELLESADAVLARPGSAAILNPADSREIHDGRRYNIVCSCCYIWMDAGRPLTYTTRPDLPSHQRRQGPLFDLIRAVMAKILRNGRHPSDETIRKDIELSRKAIKRDQELIDGP